MPIPAFRIAVAIVALVSAAEANRIRPRSLSQDEAVRTPLQSLVGAFYGVSDASGFQYHGAKLGSQGVDLARGRVSIARSSAARGSNRILMEGQGLDFKKIAEDLKDGIKNTAEGAKNIAAFVQEVKEVDSDDLADRFSRTSIPDIIAGKGLAPSGSISIQELVALTKGGPARIEFFPGVSESAVPDVQMFKAPGGGGRADFEFQAVDFSKEGWNPEGKPGLDPNEIEEMVVYDVNGVAGRTSELTALFDDDENMIGVKAVLVMKKPSQFNRFLEFMNEYAKAQGLGYEEPEKDIYQQKAERLDARRDDETAPIEM